MRLWNRALIVVSGCFCLLTACTSTSEMRLTPSQLEIGRQLYISRQYTKTLHYLRPLVQKNPEDVRALKLLANTYLAIGHRKSARKYYRAALKVDPKNHDLRIAYAYALILSKKYATARNQLRKIHKTKEYPFPEWIYNNFGLSYLQQKRYKKAALFFKKALELDPTLAIAHFNLGMCFAKEKRWTKASESFQRASNFCPGCAEPTFELAKSYVRRGKEKEAEIALQKLLKQKTNHRIRVRTRKMLKWVRQRRGAENSVRR